jgi:hypothetical protein
MRCASHCLHGKLSTRKLGRPRTAHLRRWDRQACTAHECASSNARHPAHRVRDDIVRAKQEAARDVEIGQVHKTAVLRNQPISIDAVPSIIFVPRNRWRFVVERVQIVEEKERS